MKKRSLESAFDREEEEGGVFGEKRRNREAGLLAFENPGRVERKLPGKATVVEEDSGELWRRGRRGWDGTDGCR